MTKPLAEQIADVVEGRTPAKAEPGHNSGAAPASSSAAVGNEDARLRLLIERIERLLEEKKEIADDIRDVYAEAKAVGYDSKIMRKIIALRKMMADDRREMEMLLETYKNALGMD